MAVVAVLVGAGIVIGGGIAIGKLAQKVIGNAVNQRDQQLKQALGENVNQAGQPPQQK
jgi:hypothetical protein